MNSPCYHYGGKGYWSHICCTAKHLVDLYPGSLKSKGKIETNFSYKDYLNYGHFDDTHLDIADFLIYPGKED